MADWRLKPMLLIFNILLQKKVPGLTFLKKHCHFLLFINLFLYFCDVSCADTSNEGEWGGKFIY